MKGRKRHMLVDTLGLMVLVWVHAAHIHDRTGARELLQWLGAWGARLRVRWADGGYAGELQEWARKVYGWRIEIIRKVAGKGQDFCVLPIAGLWSGPLPRSIGILVLPRTMRAFR